MTLGYTLKQTLTLEGNEMSAATLEKVLRDEFGKDPNTVNFNKLSPMTLSGTAKWLVHEGGAFLQILPERIEKGTPSLYPIHHFTLHDNEYTVFLGKPSKPRLREVPQAETTYDVKVTNVVEKGKPLNVDLGHTF